MTGLSLILLACLLACPLVMGAVMLLTMRDRHGHRDETERADE